MRNASTHVHTDYIFMRVC